MIFSQKSERDSVLFKIDYAYVCNILICALRETR